MKFVSFCFVFWIGMKYFGHFGQNRTELTSIVDSKIIFCNFFYLSLGDIFKTNLVHKNSIYTFIWLELNQMKNLILNHIYMNIYIYIYIYIYILTW